MIEFPLGLRHAIESGECVLFIGAGIGTHLLDKEGEPAPDAKSLTEELVEEFDIDIEYSNDLSKIATIVELRTGRKELEVFLQKRLGERTPDASLQWLFTRKWKAIFTTNYDNGIERAYELIGTPPQNPITISTTSDLVPVDPRFEIPIYHLHGVLFGTYKPNIIITDDDYAKFGEKRRMLFELLKREASTSTFLYIGYSNRDPNWKMLLTEMSTEFYPSKLPNSYRVDPSTEPVDVEILKSKGIETLSTTFKEFSEIAKSVLSADIIDKDKLQKLRKDMPSDLAPFFEKNIAATTRLLSSWTYVNQAPFHEDANLLSFLRGDRPNWALIAKRLTFERDIEADVYNDLLDYATNSNSSTTIISILGPAGYGSSTLLMTLAGRIVHERAGRVFMLKPNQALLEGDIEYALSLFAEPTFFFVDNASEFGAKLNDINQILKESGKSALFVLGEHINEWRLAYKRPNTKEFIVEPLSDPEIYRLLEYLERNGQLNVLAPLKREVQFSVIKEKHKKELLVAMREATEGKSFDAILEEEFRGIPDPMARRLYAIVCCFYQHDIPIRDELLARLLDVPLAEIYDRTSDSVEGVVYYDCINEAKEIYGARARHRLISAVVWERCLDVGEKNSIIQSSMEALNLNYRSDEQAFEAFTRSERLVDSIGSLEGKIKFFETAAKKDPESPYVRQHYARMLLREEKLEIALGEIEEGIKLDPSARVLQHTKGIILMEMAISNESVELAKRRLAQSEASFNQCITGSPRDEYGYQGLAELYFRWARRAPSQEEAVAYIAKAEDVITLGLRSVRVRDRLWILSSKIQEWLGDEPSRLQALATAILATPGSVVARYLLGRLHRKAGRYKEALEVLEPNIKNHQEEFRSFVEYAIALAHLQKSYKEAIATLRISDLYGMSDPRYIATLGGMLYMDKSFSQATQTFAQTMKKSFTGIELNSIQFRPPNFDNLEEALRLTGKVIDVKAGFAFIETSGYPPLLCPGSKFGGLILRKGMNVSFEPAFGPKGAIADLPKAIN
jgi:tetratricopeptide (TPR) repeat protein